MKKQTDLSQILSCKKKNTLFCISLECNSHMIPPGYNKHGDIILGWEASYQQNTLHTNKEHAFW